MSAVLKGTTCLYGVAGTVANLFVQSYSIGQSFGADDTVTNEDGQTKTNRLDDVLTEITVEGVCKTSAAPSMGASFSFTTAGGVSLTNGYVVSVSEKGGTREFVKVSITARAYEYI